MKTTNTIVIKVWNDGSKLIRTVYPNTIDSCLGAIKDEMMISKYITHAFIVKPK